MVICIKLTRAKHVFEACFDSTWQGCK